MRGKWWEIHTSVHSYLPWWNMVLIKGMQLLSKYLKFMEIFISWVMLNYRVFEDDMQYRKVLLTNYGHFIIAFKSIISIIKMQNGGERHSCQLTGTRKVHSQSPGKSYASQYSLWLKLHHKKFEPRSEIYGKSSLWPKGVGPLKYDLCAH